jgi:hypothetical protein
MHRIDRNDAFFFALPDWLTNEKSLTLATWGLVGVTFLLVVATVILYFDSRSNGNEQRERWKREDDSRASEQKARWEREDRLREEDAKPKVAVEIGKRKRGSSDGVPMLQLREHDLLHRSDGDYCDESKAFCANERSRRAARASSGNIHFDDL